jgi:deazaflavin-dependent oxidoreductase (nitroreductase family)
VGTLFMLSRGRTTGKIRRNGIFYIEDGSSLVVVASNAGEDTEPNWWRNLQANPNAEVEVGRRRIPVRARAATEGEEARICRDSTRATASTPHTAGGRPGGSRSSSSSPARASIRP